MAVLIFGSFWGKISTIQRIDDSLKRTEDHNVKLIAEHSGLTEEEIRRWAKKYRVHLSCNSAYFRFYPDFADTVREDQPWNGMKETVNLGVRFPYYDGRPRH